jgi:putative methyltransferase
LLLVHDLLLAKGGIALPAAHGLRAAVERHKVRLRAELAKARVGRKLGSMDALKHYVNTGQEASSNSELQHPRWIRINTIKTQLEDQLETTFAEYERVGSAHAVRQREVPRLYIDEHVPNLIAIPASADLTKSEAYRSGAIIFQDKASCFPAYLLDPLPEDGDFIDTCAAPGNKTTHLAAILSWRASELDDHSQTIYAFEKDKARAETLTKMVTLSNCEEFTKIHAGQDFLKVDPNAPEYRNVGALLLDPSCSGSGIVGRDGMPELHLPELSTTTGSSTTKGKPRPQPKETLKRKRSNDEESFEIVDDDGIVTPMTSNSDLQNRLQALSAFQLSLLLHAFAFPPAHKITYSTCSIHSTENEAVVSQALGSKIAKERGWRILRRDEQVRGMREWPIRGDKEACKEVENSGEVADGCIRANKDDDFGTMGFFVAGFVRDRDVSRTNQAAARVMRDEKGFIIRDLMGIPVMALPDDEEEEWRGFGDDDYDEGHASADADASDSSSKIEDEPPQTSDVAATSREDGRKRAKKSKLKGKRK